jgi:hypothetical protein
MVSLQERFGARLFVRDALRSRKNAFLDGQLADHYRKGEDVLVDALLLARCTLLLKAASAVGEFAVYFSWPRLRNRTIDLQYRGRGAPGPQAVRRMLESERRSESNEQQNE